MKKIIFSAVTAALIFCGCGGNKTEDAAAETAQAGIYGEALPITRGEAGRMLALCLYDYGEIISLENKADFADVSREDKLYKYINAVYSFGLMVGDGVNFRSGDYLTVGEAEALIAASDSSGRLKIETEENTLENPISYYMWLQILEKLGEAEVFRGVEKREMTVLMTGEGAEEIEGYVLCSEGLYKSDDFVPEKFENTVSEFLVKDSSLIGICSVVSDSPVFERCLVTDCSKGEAVIFYGGCKKTYKTETEISSKTPFIADAAVKGDRLLNIERYTTEKYGRVIAVGENILFDDGYSYAVDDNMAVYSVYEGIKSGGSEAIISGSYARVIFKDNTAVCVLCEDEPEADIIRVALSSSEGGLIHKSVEISSEQGFTLKSGENETEYMGGQILNINPENQGSLFKGKKISLISRGEGKIYVNGTGYEGRIDIISCEGGYNVVCEMDLNNYLYGVVCAEMPPSYGEEALKAQALAARSYAYNQRLGNKRIASGANIDDTTAFQVYDPNSVCDDAIKAVGETGEEMIVYEGKVINACFYSTSCGIGANSGEVWPEGTYKTPEYLSSRVIGDIKAPDFSDEEEALKFFKTVYEGSYEADCPYYRWSFRADKSSFKADIKNIGNIERISVTKRGEGGNVTEVLIEGEEKDIVVQGESNIRSLLSPGDVKLNDGTVKEFQSLPSCFFAVEEVSGEFYFYGGGYGHGVGMSQNGAEALAAQGMDYKKIIEYFYKGAAVEKL
ncbi:MAG: SpoIID/LytB domain-containing protein [Clostridiales bacterium]|nr:SpoIID/LytB domain-containing protein [Clostridiales bacterium]